MNKKIDETVFERMSINQIDTLLDRLHEKETRIIDESPYGAWFEDPQFVQIKMLQDGLQNLREYREILEESEILVPGFTYYNGVRQFGKRVEGKVCTYLGENRPANWINFIDSSPILKTLEVLRHGNVGDFRRLYVEIADGRADGLENVSLQHITESTDRALLTMEAYCDARWEGPWPWEVPSPYRIGRIIEENKQMRQQTLTEMHEILNQILREFDEGGQEQFEIISMVRNMSENVQAMIEKFAKLAGDAMINLRAMVMTRSGDEGAMKVEHGLTQAVNNCADALARLKVQLDDLTGQLDIPPQTDMMNGGGMGAMGGAPGMGAGPEMGGDMGGGEMGGPAMGAEPPMGGGAPGMAPEQGAAPGGAMPPEMPPERARKRS